MQDVVTPFWLMQVGRSLVREGASLSVLNMGGTGAMELTPAAFYNFEALETPGAEREADWHCRVTTYGPSSSYTRLLARDRSCSSAGAQVPEPAIAVKGPKRRSRNARYV